MAESAFVVVRPPRQTGEKVHDLPELLKAVTGNRVPVKAGFMMQDEETVQDVLEFVRLGKRLNEKLKAETARRAAAESRRIHEAGEPQRRAEAERRVRAEAEEMVARDLLLERQQRIERHVARLTGRPAPKPEDVQVPQPDENRHGAIPRISVDHPNPAPPKKGG